jgi:hypothetical protein
MPPRVAPLLLLIAACTPATRPHEADRDPSPAPRRVSAAEMAVCTDYQAQLSGYAESLPAVYAGAAAIGASGEPVVAGAPPIPESDEDAARFDRVALWPTDVTPKVVVESPSTGHDVMKVDLTARNAPKPPPRPPGPSEVEAWKRKRATVTVHAPVPPRLYVSAERGTSAAQVIALRDALPAGTELALIVAHTPDELRVTQLAVVPRTPSVVLERLPLELDDVAVEMLVDAAGECRPVLAAFATYRNGAVIDTIGPATARALAGCGCDVTDLDTYVAVLSALLVPMPQVGAVTVRNDVLDGLPKDATVDDLARALL